MSPTLSVVAGNELKALKQETVGDRVRRLQAEARQLAKDHVHLLSEQLIAVQKTASEVAAGGEAYPPGVRDLASRLAEDIDARVQTLEAIVSRTL